MSTSQLTPRQIKEFRATAHALKPVVMIGSKGLTDAVVKETNKSLEVHELIKVKIAAERDSRKVIAQQLLEQTGAVLVQEIGQMVTIYRKRTD